MTCKLYGYSILTRHKKWGGIMYTVFFMVLVEQLVRKDV